MSKPTKAKSDKHKAAPTAQTPQLISEIIPGKFTDSDWLAVLQLDDNEDFIGSLVQEIRQAVDEKIKAIEIERQLAPYTVGKVMDFVLDLFKLAYPEHQDSQELNSSWEADFPPECSAIDSWAEGSVPKQIMVSLTVPQSRASHEEDEPAAAFVKSQEIDQMEEPGVTFELIGPASEEAGSANFIAPKRPHPPKEPKQEGAGKKKPFKPNVSILSVQRAIGLVDTSELSESIPPATDEKRTVAASSGNRSKAAGSSKAAKTALIAAVGKASLQREKGRPPMEKDVNYDAYGNIVSMIRISPESFPPLFVPTDYMVVDPRVEKANAELEAMRTGRYIQKKLHIRQPVKLKPLPMTIGLHCAQVIADRRALCEPTQEIETTAVSPRRSSNFNIQSQQVDKQAKVLQARSIIEQIDLSPGVDFREGSQEKRGADIRLLSGAVFLQQETALLPMTQRPQVTGKLMEVNQLVNKAPTIKPIA